MFDGCESRVANHGYNQSCVEMSQLSLHPRRFMPCPCIRPRVDAMLYKPCHTRKTLMIINCRIIQQKAFSNGVLFNERLISFQSHCQINRAQRKLIFVSMDLMCLNFFSGKIRCKGLVVTFASENNFPSDVIKTRIYQRQPRLDVIFFL